MTTAEAKAKYGKKKKHIQCNGNRWGKSKARWEERQRQGQKAKSKIHEVRKRKDVGKLLSKH